MLNKEELKTIKLEEIPQRVDKLRKELYEMMMEKATSGLEKSHRLKEVRQDIARLLTVETQRRREARS